MIDGWLTKEFKEQFKKADIDKILWFDAGREYERLLPYFEKDFNIIKFDGSLLRMKYEVEVKGGGKRWILYLPISREDSDYLKEYEFTSYIFEKPLYSYLSRKGVSFPKDKEEKETIKAALPLLAERSISKDKSFWENLSKEKLADLLFPEFYKEIIEFIEKPFDKYKALKNDGIEKLFFAKVKKEFGIAPPENDPKGWIEKLSTCIFLTEVYLNLGEPDGYPFINLVVATGDARKRAVAFLKYWASNSQYKELFREKSKQIEERHNLVKWAKKIPLDKQKSFSLLGLAKNAWNTFYESISNISSKQHFINYMASDKDELIEMSSSFWAKEGEVPGWKVSLQALSVMDVALLVDKEISSLNTADAFVASYSREWWKLDKEYRNFKMLLKETNIDLSLISSWVNKIYDKAVGDVNSRFSETLEKLKEWELKLPHQRDFWKDCIEKNKKKIAIFFIDALRFELGKTLEEKLSEHYKVESKAFVAEIPTETLIGMAMLLPHNSGGPKVAYVDERLIVEEAEGGDRISKNEDRKARIQSHFSDVCFVELNDLTKPSYSAVKKRLLIVFSVELDALGEALGASALEIYDDLLKSIEKGVAKALDLGVDEVHIVTDHGFLILEKVKDFEKIEIKGRNILEKSERYAIGNGLEAGNHLKFTLNEEQGLEILFPRGTYCFKAPGKYDFLHGGISLQEVVIPHLVVEKSFKESKISVEIELSKEIEGGIRNQIFKIKLVPVKTDLFATLSRNVRVFCEKEGEKISNEAVETVGEGAVEVTLRVEPTVKLGYGEEITIKAVDDENFELLDEKKVKTFLAFDVEL